MKAHEIVGYLTDNKKMDGDMLDFLPGPVKGVASFLIYLINTILLCSLIFVVALFKLLIPISALRSFYDRTLIAIAMTWIAINGFVSNLFNRIDWQVRGVEALEKNEWYLVLSNHQSWVDILVLQRVFRGKIPMLKFFLKKELIWVPILGLAWWALDFPFMRRYSKAFLEKHPHLKGKDLATTKKACEKFRSVPVSVMNFVEGTRFTEIKHARQHSPYDHLLMPKAGGVAFVLGAMGDCIRKIIDVTIVYPDGADSFWGFLSGRIRRIAVDVTVLPVPDQMSGDYFDDPEAKVRFCDWINQLWQQKDRKISAILVDESQSIN